MNNIIFTYTFSTKSISINGLKIIGLSILLFLSNSLRAQLDYGNNLWSVNCYNSISAAPTTMPSIYRGSYTQKLDVSENYGFNTTLSWGVNSLPSNASAFNSASGQGTKYVGSVVNVAAKKFTYIHKREGFPRAKYKITMRVWDDNTYLFIDGIRIPFSGDAGYGADRMIVNCFELTPTSRVEVRTSNDGGNDSQAILDIVKTDIMFAETLTSKDVCNNSEITLDAKIKVETSNFRQDIYKENFESTGLVSAGGWAIGMSNKANSGSDFIFASSPSNNTPLSYDMGSFSTNGFDNVKMSLRSYYARANNTTGKVQLSTDNNNWTTIYTFEANNGTSTVFYPTDIDVPTDFSNKQNVYFRFLYTRLNSGSGGFWAMDDILVTGVGPANITYSWSPTTGLSDPNISNPTVNIASSQTYTLSVTAGNCLITNDVVINMAQIPAQSVVQSLPNAQPNVYSVVPVNGITYTWTTIPATGVGEFPRGVTGSSVEFNPIGNGDLVVTPSNVCGTGLSLTFNNPLPVELTNFSIACEQGVIVNWSTASEKNADIFIVEKSRDLERWTNVATINAAGNSNVKIDYSVVDANSWNGIAYYRLRQIDFNGFEKIYGPISSVCESGENSMIVYPNPSKGAFTVEVVSTNSNAKTQLQIMDVTGKIIAAHAFKLESGVNQLYFNSSDLNVGVYIIRLVGGSSSIETMRLVIE